LGSLDLLEGPTIENFRKNLDLLLFWRGLEKGSLVLLAFLP